MEALTARDDGRRTAPEANALSQKLADARRQLVEEFEQHHKLSREEALARVRDFDNAQFAELIVRQPLRSTTWQNLDQLTAVDPELAAQRWNAVVDDAVGEIETGHHAAAAVETGSGGCWQRAQFLAVRESLARDWQPQSGIEWSLVDSMTQALSMKAHWLQRMLAIDALETVDEPLSTSQLPRMDVAKAIDQAAQMADRFDRMFMRALRQLRDLRRYTVVVQHAEQVNVGQQQINVGRSG
jgi:hypothetical protein